MQKASTSFSENMRRRGFAVPTGALDLNLTKEQRLDAVSDRLEKLEKSAASTPAAVADQAGQIMAKAAELARSNEGTAVGQQARRLASKAFAAQTIAKGMMGRTD